MESITQRCLHYISDKGYLEGVTFLDASSRRPKCYRFGRVPYARPWTSSRRWKRAQALPDDCTYGPKETPSDFTELSAVCPQAIYNLNRSLDPSQMTEGCLQCNIWIPIGETPAHGWPVWIYLRMSKIIRKKLILITFRWWLPAMGFSEYFEPLQPSRTDGRPVHHCHACLQA